MRRREVERAFERVGKSENLQPKTGTQQAFSLSVALVLPTASPFKPHVWVCVCVVCNGVVSCVHHLLSSNVHLL